MSEDKQQVDKCMPNPHNCKLYETQNLPIEQWMAWLDHRRFRRVRSCAVTFRTGLLL